MEGQIGNLQLRGHHTRPMSITDDEVEKSEGKEMK